eukprot:GILK01003901.1.p1 GENE.GILK01003901.1~~GILK01003901.1.p1  ORF type:complete len:318 (+),score=46.52 GILK01003901.1:39-992(+)
MSFGANSDFGKGAQFVFGGTAACIASAATHPVDLIKVRMQLQGELNTTAPSNGAVPAKKVSSFGAAANIARQEGSRGLYKGLTASLFRQACYSSTRFGLYAPIKDAMSSPSETVFPTYKKFAAGMTAGGLGAFVGCPGDVVMVRMQADGRLPVEQRRNYRHVFDGLRRIVSEEGAATLWRGSRPTVLRAMLTTSAQLGTYDEVKIQLLASGYFKDGMPAHFCSSMTAGFLATVVSSPVDVVKTRIMNMKDGGMKYTSAFDCFVKTVKLEGPFGLYKGFWPNFFRLGPHTIVMLMAYEQIQKTATYVKRTYFSTNVSQ